MLHFKLIYCSLKIPSSAYKFNFSFSVMQVKRSFFPSPHNAAYSCSLYISKDAAAPWVWVGGKECSQPYSTSLMNISAMSNGALSKNDILL